MTTFVALYCPTFAEEHHWTIGPHFEVVRARYHSPPLLNADQGPILDLLKYAFYIGCTLLVPFLNIGGWFFGTIQTRANLASLSADFVRNTNSHKKLWPTAPE